MKKNYGWIIVALLFVLGVLNFADKAIIGFAAVPIINELHLSPSQWGLIGSCFFWFFAISSIIVTSLSDRFGAKRIITGMVSLWTIIQFASIFVFNLPSLMATRTILGAGEGPSASLSYHLTAKWFPPKRRAFASAIMISGNYVGPALFAPLLIEIIVSYGWRTAFGFLGVCSALWIPIWLWLGKESPEDIGLPVEKTQVSHEKVRWSALFPVLFSRNFIFTTLAGFAAYWSLSVMIVWNPPYLATVHHLGESGLKWIAGLPWITIALGHPIIGYLSDRLLQWTGDSRKARVYVIGPLFVISAVCFYFSTIVSSTPAVIILLTLAPSLINMTFVLGSAIVSESTHPSLRGSAQGFYIGTSSVAGLIAPVVFGKFIENAGEHGVIGYNHAFLLTSGLVFVFGLCQWIFVDPKRAKTSTNDEGVMLAIND
ncbi:MFS family permease [Neobacillus sp. B4I6]|jgi:MFS family permease|uniref:MFS transporter n=1 Tax=Neobacillus sp. B4I6 TaxID=3373925 RepID=UPI003D243201